MNGTRHVDPHFRSKTVNSRRRGEFHNVIRFEDGGSSPQRRKGEIAANEKGRPCPITSAICGVCGVESELSCPNYLQKLKVSGFPRSLEKHRRAKEGNREKEKDTTKREGRKKTQKSTTGNGPKETHKLLSEHSPQVGGKMQQSERNPAVSTPMFATK